MSETPHLWVPSQLPPRKAILLQPPNGGQIILPLHKLGKSQRDEILDAELEKAGVPKEQRQSVIEKAEKDYENRVHVAQVRNEIRRRLEGQVPHMRKKGGRWKFQK